MSPENWIQLPKHKGHSVENSASKPLSHQKIAPCSTSFQCINKNSSPASPMQSNSSVSNFTDRERDDIQVVKKCQNSHVMH